MQYRLFQLERQSPLICQIIDFFFYMRTNHNISFVKFLGVLLAPSESH